MINKLLITALFLMLPMELFAQQPTQSYPISIKVYNKQGNQLVLQVGGILTQINSNGPVYYGLRANYRYCPSYPAIPQYQNQLSLIEACNSLDISTSSIDVQIMRTIPQVTGPINGIYNLNPSFTNAQHLSLQDINKPIMLTNTRGEQTGEYILIERSK